MEVHLDCSTEACEARDYKGMFQLAKSENHNVFPGVTEAYELSDSPELTLKTDHLTIEECARIYIKRLYYF